MPHTGWQGRLSGMFRASWWRVVAAAGVVALAAEMALLAGADPAAATPLRAARPAAPVLVFSPAPYDYGQVSDGQVATQTFTLANSGNKATGHLRVRLSGPAAFTITGDHCRGTRLRPDRTCTITVQFAPASAGQQAATLTAASLGHRASVSDALTGTGTSLGLAPAQIYWTSATGIWAANLDGSSPHAIVTSLTSLNSPAGVAVDSSHLYWADSGTDTINEASLDGTGPHSIVTGRIFPVGVAVSGSHIYWSDEGNLTEGSGSIWEANLDGSDPHAVVTGQNGPDAVAVGAGHLYWADNGLNDEAGDGTIWEANLDGSSPHTIVTGQSLGGGMAADTSHLYWSSLGDTPDSATIDEAGLDGTSPHPIVTSLNSPAGVASNASNIYWTDADAGTINQANPDGTSPHTIVTGQAAPTLFMAVTPAAPQLAFTPAPFSYGQVSTGQAATQEFTLFNSGETATGPLTVTVSGSAAFTVTSDTCTGTSLGPGQPCLVTVRFAPPSAGPAAATLMTASQDPAATATDALSGTGVGAG
jgi:hypothetical protein